ncbi:DUF2652 domain-containing protein [Flavobacterium anhuiense]|uniref:DUF2652 domain-containing protein n=1 Tax=Flavobacterium anhuiense TaxID=459526 RepID=UPI0020263101|nr:DUF2652 domain-containing protein [Flavobacterium anhuiense]URM36101.1 DUF2652 domain-containing protein [Flavobacterium anhuiense]
MDYRNIGLVQKHGCRIMNISHSAQDILHRYRNEAGAIKAEQGLILIPDVSGFTDFVPSICIEAGSYILRELLMAIMDSNRLGMKVSEVEGDAVLFYKFGLPPQIDLIIEQYEIMLKNFREKLDAIESLIDRKLNLSLKLVAHYGLFAEYAVGGFSKLYGNAVVQSHCLLKNAIQSSTYLLFTSELLNCSGSDRSFASEENYSYIDYKNRNLA